MKSMGNFVKRKRISDCIEKINENLGTLYPIFKDNYVPIATELISYIPKLNRVLRYEAD